MQYRTLPGLSTILNMNLAGNDENIPCDKVGLKKSKLSKKTRKVKICTERNLEIISKTVELETTIQTHRSDSEPNATFVILPH